MNLRVRPRVNSARKCFYDDRKTIAGFFLHGIYWIVKQLKTLKDLFYGSLGEST